MRQPSLAGVDVLLCGSLTSAEVDDVPTLPVTAMPSSLA